MSHARTERGLSQRKLAQLVGLNYQVIRRLEAGGDDGNLLIREFERLCRTLGVHPVSLLADPADHTPQAMSEDDRELDLGQARLLRRIQRGDEVRRSLSADEQQVILPTLLKNHLVTTAKGGRLILTPAATGDLADPESTA